MRVEDSLGLVGVGLRRGSTCQRDVATHTLHGAAVRCTQSTCSLLGRLGVRVVGDEQVKLRLSERLSDPAADAARAASHDSSATQSIALRDQEQQRHTHHRHTLWMWSTSLEVKTNHNQAFAMKNVRLQLVRNRNISDCNTATAGRRVPLQRRSVPPQNKEGKSPIVRVV